MPSNNGGPDTKVSTLTKQEFKLDWSQAVSIVAKHDKPAVMVPILLGGTLILLASPLWISPLVGISIWQGLLFMFIYILMNSIFMAVVKIRATALIARKLAVVIGNAAKVKVDNE
jgi:hypothetical protein